MKAQDRDIPKLKQSTIEKQMLEAITKHSPFTDGGNCDNCGCGAADYFDLDRGAAASDCASIAESEAIAFAEWIHRKVTLMDFAVNKTASELYSLFKESTK